MLDTLYKGGIVAITINQVNDKEVISAGTAFKQLFKTAEINGWHQVRLLDATDNPYNDENSPADKFEKAAVRKLVAGESWVEEIEVRDGVQHMRVVTPIPVVFDKCVMCHDHYEDVKEGKRSALFRTLCPLTALTCLANVKSGPIEKAARGNLFVAILPSESH